MKHWSPAKDTRRPWVSKATSDAIVEWVREIENAEMLRAAGEKVFPLLLSGESRCGKTSTICMLADTYFKVPCYRMSISSIESSYMGETAKALKSAIDEAAASPPALWIVDEVDAILQRRGGTHATSEKERTSAVAAALTMLDTLPPHLVLVGTTNRVDIMDSAAMARFIHVEFPKWGDLADEERESFARSHGCEKAWAMLSMSSYAGVVLAARKDRVKKILDKKK